MGKNKKKFFSFSSFFSSFIFFFFLSFCPPPSWFLYTPMSHEDSELDGGVEGEEEFTLHQPDMLIMDNDDDGGGGGGNDEDDDNLSASQLLQEEDDDGDDDNVMVVVSPSFTKEAKGKAKEVVETVVAPEGPSLMAMKRAQLNRNKELDVKMKQDLERVRLERLAEAKKLKLMQEKEEKEMKEALAVHDQFMTLPDPHIDQEEEEAMRSRVDRGIPKEIIIIFDNQEREGENLNRRMRYESVLRYMSDPKVAKEAEAYHIHICTKKDWETLRLNQDREESGGIGNRPTELRDGRSRAIIMKALKASKLKSASLAAGDIIYLNEEGVPLMIQEHKTKGDLWGCMFSTKGQFHFSSQLERLYNLKTGRDLNNMLELIPIDDDELESSTGGPPRIVGEDPTLSTCLVEMVVSGFASQMSETEAKAVMTKTRSSCIPWLYTNCADGLDHFVWQTAKWLFDPERRFKRNSIAQDLLGRAVRAKGNSLTSRECFDGFLRVIPGMGEEKVKAVTSTFSNMVEFVMTLSRPSNRNRMLENLQTANGTRLGKTGTTIYNLLGFPDYLPSAAAVAAVTENGNEKGNEEVGGDGDAVEVDDNPMTPVRPPKPSKKSGGGAVGSDMVFTPATPTPPAKPAKKRVSKNNNKEESDITSKPASQNINNNNKRKRAAAASASSKKAVLEDLRQLSPFSDSENEQVTATATTHEDNNREEEEEEEESPTMIIAAPLAKKSKSATKVTVTEDSDFDFPIRVAGKKAPLYTGTTTTTTVEPTKTAKSTTAVSAIPRPTAVGLNLLSSATTTRRMLPTVTRKIIVPALVSPPPPPKKSVAEELDSIEDEFSIPLPDMPLIDTTITTATKTPPSSSSSNQKKSGNITSSYFNDKNRGGSGGDNEPVILQTLQHLLDSQDSKEATTTTTMSFQDKFSAKMLHKKTSSNSLTGMTPGFMTDVNSKLATFINPKTK